MRMWRRRLQAHGFDVARLEMSIIIRYEDDLILFARRPNKGNWNDGFD